MRLNEHAGAAPAPRFTPAASSSARGRVSYGGFTLIEVMVVVVILSILAAIVVPKIMDRPDEARITKAKQDIRALEAALNLYKLDNFSYPTTDQGLEALVQPPTTEPIPPKWKQGGYLDRLPQDPWGRPYMYLSPGDQGRAFDLYSLGADGQPGGAGAAADIGNWALD
ncbi:MAG: type II secretion system major pseudopilin GspG [Pseudomonadota bacterium]